VLHPEGVARATARRRRCEGHRAGVHDHGHGVEAGEQLARG
jgi:hypothetical protein